MWLSLPSLHTLLEYGSALSRQRLNLMLVLQQHLTTLPKRVPDQGGAGNEVVHGSWTAYPPGCGAWAELSQRHRTERRKARAIRGTRRRLPTVSPCAPPGGECDGPRHPALACLLCSAWQQARGSLSISPTSEGSVWHNCHQRHCDRTDCNKTQTSRTTSLLTRLFIKNRVCNCLWQLFAQGLV